MGPSTASPKPGSANEPASGASQTLVRGLDVIEAIASRTMTLGPLAERLGLTKSTTHRLASALVEKGYLAFTPRSGYRLGAKLLYLGALAQEQADLVQVARGHLEQLAASTEDTVHLGIQADDGVLYVDKVPGQRRINISSRVGERQALTSTGLGKALILDDPVEGWRACYRAEQPDGSKAMEDLWIERMHGYAAAGRAFDLEENEDQIRCVSVAVRDARGRIVGGISVSGAAQYMSDARMNALSDEVKATAEAIGRDLGWQGPGHSG